MDNGLTTLCGQVAVGPDGDAEEVAQAALQLRRELLDLDVHATKCGASASRRRGPGRSMWRRSAP